jgi:phage regulator Rha-like protein
MENQIQINPGNIAEKIYFIRGEKVLLDFDLAPLYNIESKRLKAAVRRNIKRFPDDFMFELTKVEYHSLRTQNASLKRGEHVKYMPYAFTEQGLAMLSGILNSERAINVNIAIMRAFVQMRRMLETHKELAKKIEELESKYDEQFSIVFEAIRQLIQKDNEPRNPVGFKIGLSPPEG